jgi:cell division protein FtsW
MRYNSSGHFFLRQLAWAVVSFCFMMYLKRQDYRLLKSPTWAFAALGVVLMLLVVVYFVDRSSHRWLRFGAFSIQPSEFAKPALILFLAWFVTVRSRAINSRHTLLPAAVALALLAGTVVVADLGTAVVLVATAAAVFYVAGLERRYVALMVAGTAVCVMAAVIAKPYRLGRIIGYLDPEYKVLDRINPGGHVKRYIHSSLAPRDVGYQARQAQIAVGAGGVAGRGLMQGKQKFFYLPEPHTDFIYAVVGEELGLLGCTALLAGFLVILYRGLRLFWLATDDFGRYLALGVVSAVVFQALINMSVVLDLAPTKGIPLPLISHGGSSLLSTLTSLGLLLSVSEHAG